MATNVLAWDEAGKKFYETGVDHAVLYPIDTDGEYPQGYAWNGIVSVTESPSGGEANDLWADNIKYASLRSTESFGFTIEAYMYPDEFAECDGFSVYNGKAKLGQQTRKKFGFVYRTKVGNDSGSEHYLLHLIWSASATPSEKNYQTINDSPDAITFSWECDTTPVTVTDPSGDAEYKPIANMTIDESKLTKTELDDLHHVLFGYDGDEGDEEESAIVAHLPMPSEILESLGE